MAKLMYIGVELMGPIDGNMVMRKLELAARTCYKSEKNITDVSADKMVKRLLKDGHLSVLEHESLSFRVICDRSTSHQWVRHRILSYSQECVSGDTIIKSNKGKHSRTIKELYDLYNRDCYGKSAVKRSKIFSCTDDNMIVPNKINHIFYKGKAKTYIVKTKNGYAIKCTKNHEFKTMDGFVTLGTLNVGDKLYVNGRKKIILKISDDELTNLYINDKCTPIEISDYCGVSYRTIVNALIRLDIFVARLNDKDKNKYNKNHTKESYINGGKTRAQMIKDGKLSSWNKGITADMDEHVAKISKNLTYKNKPGELSSNWLGGKTYGGHCTPLKSNVMKCEICHKIFDNNSKYEIHHIDRNRSNNKIGNLLKLCINCHQMAHKGIQVKYEAYLDEIISIEYFGEEDVYDLEMKNGNHNYIADGFVVHNSQRYINYTKNKSNNEIKVIKPIELNEKNYKIFDDAMEYAENKYFELIAAGEKPEVARCVLPNACKTELVISGNIRAWIEFLIKRLDSHAQADIRFLSNQIINLIKNELPCITDHIKSMIG